MDKLSLFSISLIVAIVLVATAVTGEKLSKEEKGDKNWPEWANNKSLGHIKGIIYQTYGRPINPTATLEGFQLYLRILKFRGHDESDKKAYEPVLFMTQLGELDPKACDTEHIDYYRESMVQENIKEWPKLAHLNINPYIEAYLPKLIEVCGEDNGTNSFIDRLRAVLFYKNWIEREQSNSSKLVVNLDTGEVRKLRPDEIRKRYEQLRKKYESY